MLDLIRKNASSVVVKGILILVIGAFLGTIGLIWGAGGFSGVTGDNMAARVNNKIISISTYSRAFEAKKNIYRNIYREGFSNKIIEGLRLRERTLDELIQRELLLTWAGDLGFEVTNDELRKAIYSYKAFQQEGIFNPSLYQELLLANQISPAEFEQSQREENLINKLQLFVVERVKVSDEEVRQEYLKLNEEISVRYLVFDPLSYEPQVSVEDDQISSYFEQNKEEYWVTEQRRVEYISVDAKSMENQVSLMEEEIEDYYYDHEAEYTIPAQVQASHILIKVSSEAKPKVVEETRKKAEEIRAKLMAGEAFAKLAAEFSEDTATAVKGGDLGYFSKGSMVPAFEQAAFSLEKDDISQPVKTMYGYHIIKVTDIKPSLTKPLEEVRSQIEGSLKQEKSFEGAHELANNIYAQLLVEKDLPEVAQTHSLEIKQTGFFFRDGEIPELGKLPQMSTVAFELNPEDISPPVRLAEGYVLLKYLEVKPPYIPSLEDVSEEVKRDIIVQQSQDLAEKWADTAQEKLASGFPPETYLQLYNYTLLDGGTLSRQGVIKGIGSARTWIPTLFAMQPGDISPVLERDNDNKYYLIRVDEVLPVDEAKFQQGKKKILTDLKNQKTQEILTDWLKHLMDKADIEINQALIR